MNKWSNILYSLGCLLSVSVMAQAQPKVGLRLSFNSEQNRYEVTAQANFSAKNFTWGPSQVSIVLPQSVANEPLSVRSTNVGTWGDNSSVFAPGSAASLDFHGITTTGGKLDLVAGEEYLLFDFSLKNGFVENVRLFDNTLDPGSEKAGMKGGDFRSYMSDEKGNDYLLVDSRFAPLSVKKQDVLSGNELSGEVQVVAYPNPSTGGKFRLYLKGFEPKEMLNARFLNINGAAIRTFDESAESLGSRVIDLGELTDAYVILRLERQSNNQVFSHKLWFR